MTPTPQQVERAESLAEKYCTCPAEGKGHTVATCWLARDIASALAAESAEAERRAWEAAVKIADEHYSPGPDWTCTISNVFRARAAASRRERDERIERLTAPKSEYGQHLVARHGEIKTAAEHTVAEAQAMVDALTARVEALEGALKRARLTFSDLGADGSVARIDAALAPPPSRESQV